LLNSNISLILGAFLTPILGYCPYYSLLLLRLFRFLNYLLPPIYIYGLFSHPLGYWPMPWTPALFVFIPLNPFLGLTIWVYLNLCWGCYIPRTFFGIPQPIYTGV